MNSDFLPKKDKLLERLLVISDIKSVVININKDKTNVILGRAYKTLWGDDYIYDELCGVKIRLSPLSFYQVNHAQAQRLYERAREYASLTGEETLLDMYCGAGTIGLSMADGCKDVIGVEIIRQAVADARVNAEINGIKNAEFYCADAAEAAKMLEEKGIKPDVIVLDPPRKGCEASLVETVCNMSPDRVVYVSCDPATLARDCKLFEELGYKVEKLTAVDLFPRTVHVETVVQLVRKTPDAYVDLKVDMDELDLTASEAKATYQEIKRYILDKYDTKVSNLYIAQVKEKYGIIERENYNKPKSENTKQPQCPPEKIKMIEEALRHFKMIS